MGVFDQVKMKCFCVQNHTINKVKKKIRKNICSVFDRKKNYIYTI